MLLKIHRVAHWLWKRHVPFIPRGLALFNRVVFAAGLPHQTKLGRGVKNYHSGGRRESEAVRAQLVDTGT